MNLSASNQDELPKTHFLYMFNVTLLEGLVGAIQENFVEKLLAEIHDKPEAAEQAFKSLFSPSKVLPEKLTSGALKYTALMTPAMIYNMALIYRCALFDAFISDVVRLVLLSFPVMLKSTKTLTHEQVIDFVAGGTVMDCIAETTMSEFERLPVRDQIKWIDKRFGITIIPQTDLLEALVEIFARRNLLVHAGGAVDQRYRLDTRSKDTIGTLKICSEQYWKDSTETMNAVGDSLVRGVAEKFGFKLTLNAEK